MSVTVTSPDHAVTVTAGPGGALTELELSSRAIPLGGQALGQAITETLRTAAARFQEQLAAETAGLSRAGAGLADILSGGLPPVPAAEPLPDLGPEAEELAAEELADSEGPEVPAELAELPQRLKAEAERQLAGYARLTEELAVLSTTVTSPDRAVSVTVAQGAVTEISIEDSVLRHGPANVARIVQGTVQQAHVEASLKMASLVQELTGPALNIREMVESAIPEGMLPGESGSGYGGSEGGRR